MYRIVLPLLFVLLASCTTTSVHYAEKSTQKADNSMFRDCRDCPDMVVLPGGSYLKGSPQDEEGRSDDRRNHDEDDLEGPGGSQVTVDVPAFAIGAFEITNEQFGAFVKDSGYQMPGGCIADVYGDGKWLSYPEATWQNLGRAFQDNYPASCIGWDAANAYTRWLSIKTGANYRLPTESEFEYAVRAGSTTRYHFGDDIEGWCEYGNVSDASFNRLYPEKFSTECNDGYESMAPVGQFKPNAFGIYDMTGNVWEWLQDCYEKSYANAPTDGSALVKDGCEARSVRGNSWGYDLPALRSADRGDDAPGLLIDGIGFRVARDPIDDASLAPDWALRVHDNRKHGFSILYPEVYIVMQTEGDIAFAAARDERMPKMEVSVTSEDAIASIDSLVRALKGTLEKEGKQIVEVTAVPVTINNGKTDAVDVVVEWTEADTDRLHRTLTLSTSDGKRRISAHVSDRASADWSDLKQLAYTLKTAEMNKWMH